MTTLVFATSSNHKLQEIRSMLPEMEVLGLRDIGITDDIPEDGDTLEENAVIKAQYLFDLTGSPSLAEDTGLEVTALNGAPGVKTARYAGEERDMAKNIARLLGELDGITDRSARFRTIIALISDQGILTFEGIVQGRIAEKPDGTGGFGYDPVFIPDGYDKTFGELPADIKNNVSHRAKAVQNLLAYLQKGGEIEKNL